MIYEIFVHNPQFIYKIQFSSMKPVDPPFRIRSASNVITMTSYLQVHRN